MPDLERLRADHAPALWEFETANREYFAAWVPDRGDDYFTDFSGRLADLLAEAETGTVHMHVIVEDGVVLGRVNLIDVADGEAELGYRVARLAAGRGVATWAVARVSELAVTAYGLRRLRARTTLSNQASHTVLLRSGFSVVGDTTLNGGEAAQVYRRDLSQSTAST